MGRSVSHRFTEIKALSGLSITDRRRSARINVFSKIELEMAGHDGVTEAYAINISYGGIGIYSRERLRVGTEVEVRIFYLTREQKENIEAIRGVVKWCREKGLWFMGGIEFKKIDEDLHPLLVSFLVQNTNVIHTDQTD